MIETHRRCPDSSEVYISQSAHDAPRETMDSSLSLYSEGDGENTDFQPWYDEGAGETYWLKPKRAAKAKNAPGADVSSIKGAI